MEKGAQFFLRNPYLSATWGQGVGDTEYFNSRAYQNDQVQESVQYGHIPTTNDTAIAGCLSPPQLGDHR